MNKIKKLYWACRVRFGHLSLQELENLCSIYMKLQDPRVAKKISLGIWKNLTKGDSEFLFKLYLRYHTADEGLLSSEWLLKNERICSVYLRSLCTRAIRLTANEEKWILDYKDSGAMLCLRYPLSVSNEKKLMQSDDFEMIECYIACHVLCESSEAQLVINASDEENANRAKEYRRLLGRYFRWQHQALGRRIFTGFMAQRFLFASDENEEFIMQVIEQCNIDNFVFENNIIRHMAFDMSPKYLVWYLANSYIADKDLVSELLGRDLPKHLHDMINISEKRREIYDLVNRSIFLIPDDWSDDERYEYACFNHEDDAEKRNLRLLEFLEPRVNKGIVSPKMSAWIAAKCPELAEKMEINLVRLKENFLKQIVSINRLNFRVCDTSIY